MVRKGSPSPCQVIGRENRAGGSGYGLTISIQASRGIPRNNGWIDNTEAVTLREERVFIRDSGLDVVNTLQIRYVAAQRASRILPLLPPT